MTERTLYSFPVSREDGKQTLPLATGKLARVFVDPSCSLPSVPVACIDSLAEFVHLPFIPGALLAEFFHIFGDYDFASCVISLRDGRPLPVLGFLSSDVGSKLKLGPFNLQDPFELSHNVAANVNEKTAQRFQRCCRAAAKYCRSLQYQRKSSKGKMWGLVRLFQPGIPEAEVPAPGGFVISLPLMMAALPAPTCDLLCQAEDVPQLWFQKVCASVAFILHDILKCSCLETEQELEKEQAAAELKQEGEPEEAKDHLSAGSKRSLEEEGKDTLSPPPKRPRADTLIPVCKSMTWNCAVWHRVWLGRRRVRRQLRGPQRGPQEKASSLELEAEVSEAIVQQEKEKPSEPLLQFTVCARSGEGVSREHNLRVSLSFMPALEHAAGFQEFFHFLQGFLPQTVEQHLVQDT